MSALRQTTGLARALFFAGVAVLIAESVVFCLYGTSVYDEGGYLYEGWVTLTHGQLPFRDFFAKLPPLLYYVYGAGQALCGPSVLVGRVESALFMFAGLTLSAWMAWRLAGPWAAVLLVWLTAGNPFALSSYLHAYAVAPTAFFLVLALALLILPRPRPAMLLGSAAAVAAMLLCRHDMLPPALVLWAYMLWRYPAPLPWRVGSVVCSGAVFALVLLPFALMAPDNVLSTLTIGKLGTHVPSVGGYAAATPATVRSIVWHVVMFLRAYAGVLLLLATALAAGVAGRRGQACPAPVPDGRAAAAPAALCGWMLAAALALWLSHVPAALATAGNVFYLLDPYLFFLAAMSAAVLFVLVMRALPVAAEAPVSPAARGASQPRLVSGQGALAAVAVFAVLMVAFTGPGPHLELSLRRPTALAQMRVGAEALARNIPPGATIFTIDDPHQFLEAGLLLPGSLTHELFAYRECPDTALVRRMRLFNDEMIREWLDGGAQYVVISAGARRFLRDGGRYSGSHRLDKLIMDRVGANYQRVAEVPGTWAGPMSIYRWRGER